MAIASLLPALVCAALAACGPASPPAAFDASGVETKLPTVAAALRDGDGVGALEELDHAAAAGPLPEGALLYRALALETANRGDEAVDALHQELAAHPGDGRAHALLARHLIEGGRLDEADAELALARRLAPTYPPTQLFSARLALQRHDDEAALRAFTDVLAADPWGSSAVEAHNGLAQILERRGGADAAGGKQHEQLAAHLKDVNAQLASGRVRLRRDPHDLDAATAVAAAWFGLFTDYGASRLRDEAEGALQRVLELKPDDPQALCSLSVVRAAQKRLDEALDLARRAVAADPQSVPPRASLALLLTQLGRTDEAVAQLEVVVTQATNARDRVHAHVDIARLLSDSADPAQRSRAKSHAQAALDEAPDDPFGARKLLERLAAPAGAAPGPTPTGSTASKPGSP